MENITKSHRSCWLTCQHKFWSGCRTTDILKHLYSNRQPKVCKHCISRCQTDPSSFLTGLKQIKRSVNCPLCLCVVVYLLKPQKQQRQPFSPRSQQVTVLLPNMDITAIIRSGDHLTFDPLRDAE